jgi:hypothetical protein
MRIAVVFLLLSGFGVLPVQADQMDELLDRYDAEFSAAVPAPSSSVHSDYKFDQIAMAGLYTTKSLQLIYQQNQELIAKQDDLIDKYNEMIEQNREIIRLLKVIAGEPQPR